LQVVIVDAGPRPAEVLEHLRAHDPIPRRTLDAVRWEGRVLAYEGQLGSALYHERTLVALGATVEVWEGAAIIRRSGSTTGGVARAAD
jgi:hypothetical protein